MPRASNLRSYAAWLRAGGSAAQRAVQQLKQSVSPVDLGDAADVWLAWIEVDDWLDGGSTQMSRPRLDDNDFVAMSQRRATRKWIGDHPLGATPALVSVVLRGLAIDPTDGGCWLALGWLLESEHEEKLARAAYRLGLERLDGTVFEGAPNLIWCGLVRALLVTPDNVIEHAWPAMVEGRGEDPLPWRAVCSMMRDTMPDRTRALLEQGLASPHHASAVCEALISCRMIRGELLAARGLAQAGLEHHGGSEAYLHLLVEIAARTADVKAFQSLFSDPDPTGWQHRLREFLLDGPPAESLLTRMSDKHGLLPQVSCMETQRLVERGQHAAAAVHRATPFPRGCGGQMSLSLGLELATDIGDQALDGESVSLQRALLSGDPPFLHPAGSLARPGAQRWTERFLANLREQNPRSLDVASFEALWLARAHRHAASLAALRRAREVIAAGPEPRASFGNSLPWSAKPGPPQLDDAVVVEVLARPLWSREGGTALAEGVLAAALGEPGPTPGTRAADYLDALRARDLEQADLIATEALAAGHPKLSAFWIASLARLAHVRRDANALNQARRRGRLMMGFGGHGRWLSEELAAIGRTGR